MRGFDDEKVLSVINTFEKLNADVAILTETHKWGVVTEKYDKWTLYNSGPPMGQKREKGVGLLIRLPTVDVELEAFSERLFKANIGSYKAIIVGVYAPTDCGYGDDEKTTFYDLLTTVIIKAETEARQLGFMTIVGGDFNCRISYEAEDPIIILE